MQLQITLKNGNSRTFNEVNKLVKGFVEDKEMLFIDRKDSSYRSTLHTWNIEKIEVKRF